jgi:hypothetical protein
MPRVMALPARSRRWERGGAPGFVCGDVGVQAAGDPAGLGNHTDACGDFLRRVVVAAAGRMLKLVEPLAGHGQAFAAGPPLAFGVADGVLGVPAASSRRRNSAATGRAPRRPSTTEVTTQFMRGRPVRGRGTGKTSSHPVNTTTPGPDTARKQLHPTRPPAKYGAGSRSATMARALRSVAGRAAVMSRGRAAGAWADCHQCPCMAGQEGPPGRCDGPPVESAESDAARSADVPGRMRGWQL